MDTAKIKNTKRRRLGLQSGDPRALVSRAYSTAATGACNTEEGQLDFWHNTLSLIINAKFIL